MENNESKELVIANEMLKDKNYYCSVDVKDAKNQGMLFNALEGCDELISREIGKEIKLKDVYMEQYVKEKDGRKIVAIRTILFDADGKSHVSTAYGIANSVQRLIRVFGDPSTWSEPKSVKFIERPLKDGKKSFVLKLV